MNTYFELLGIVRNRPDRQLEAEDSVSEMDIIYSQALLMEAGSVTLKAIKSGELALIFAGLVQLGYCSLEVLARLGHAADENTEEMSGDYLMIVIMRRLMQKIAACASGDAKDYYKLYRYCAHLSKDFINADFENAIRFYHDWRRTPENEASSHVPDLTDYLFE